MQIENNRYKMDAAKASKILREASASALALVDNPAAEGDDFRNWFEPAELGVRAIFGEGSVNHRRFVEVPRRGEFAHESELYDRWQCLKEGVKVLDLFAFEVETFWDGAPKVSSVDRVVSTLEAFPDASRRLADRARNRPALVIEDEYDVQYLLHSFLSLLCADVRIEEPTASFAGGWARMDFFLPSERLAIEVKVSRPSLTGSKIGEELLLDIRRYEGRTDCDALVCFVLDPEGRIMNRAGLVRDIERTPSRLSVRALIAS